MNIMVTLDSNYIKPLEVMLKSLFVNNHGEHFTIYLTHSSITDSEFTDLKEYIHRHGHELIGIRVEDDFFDHAPTFLYYPKEMYYRLLAHRYLPEELERIVYLDPDILVLNSMREYYDTDLEGYLYAASCRENPLVLALSRVRLRPHKIEAYYSSGILLMNLSLQRKLVSDVRILDSIEQNKMKLLLPDQDLFNILYAKWIKNVPEIIYNYDTRFYRSYKMLSSGETDVNYIMHNTVFMHFCGPSKPWKKNYNGRFGALYKHYEKAVDKDEWAEIG
ncbi:MAG: glycosyltransferase family 8 protein [Actinobacteria bacterium]|nr:glycosyltransferase family 8 protein [Actinomycetota bacterium]